MIINLPENEELICADFPLICVHGKSFLPWFYNNELSISCLGTEDYIPVHCMNNNIHIYSTRAAELTHHQYIVSIGNLHVLYYFCNLYKMYFDTGSIKNRLLLRYGRSTQLCLISLYFFHVCIALHPIDWIDIFCVIRDSC